MADDGLSQKNGLARVKASMASVAAVTTACAALIAGISSLRTAWCNNIGILCTAKVSAVLTQQITTKRVKMNVSEGYLNLRSGPGQDQKILAHIPAGSTGIVIKDSCLSPNDTASFFPFCLVEWNGLRGWVSSNGLE